MVGKVELIPISEGNRITVKENEKVIVGRGSSLGVGSLLTFKIRSYHFYFSVMKKRSLVIMLNYYLKMIILFGLNQLILILYFIVHLIVKQFN
jgi:hypothetical protein